MIKSRFLQAVNFHEQGELHRAKELYLKVIEEEPQHLDCLHSLGVVCAQLQCFDEALQWLQQAKAQEPKSASIHNSLGNILSAMKQYGEAREEYQLALRFRPDYSEAYNNLGNVYYRLAQYELAHDSYLKAIQLRPNYVEAQKNIGILFCKQQKYAEAIAQFEAILAAVPHHVFSNYQLGNLYFQQERIAEAKICYQRAVENEPLHLDARNNLAACFIKEGDMVSALKAFSEILRIVPDNVAVRRNLAATFLEMGRFSEAICQYEEYLQVHGEDVEVFYNLGVAHMSQGQLPQAVDYYLKTLALIPDHLDAMLNLAGCYIKSQNRPAAKQYYQQVLQLDSENTVANYMISALSEDMTPETAPEAYIKNLFDNYANYFDRHATGGLQYQAPTILVAKVRQFVALQDARMTVLDLGCGTGLCGSAIKSWSQCLVGVDISPKMIEQARSKQIYDELIVGDMVQTLLQEVRQFDLILAADALVYVGNLQQVMRGVKRRLQSGGLFAFTVEISPVGDYYLQETGRFGHSKDYLYALAQEVKLTIVCLEEITLRQQEDKPLPGYLVIVLK